MNDAEMLKKISEVSSEAMEDIRECRREYQEMIGRIDGHEPHRTCSSWE